MKKTQKWCTSSTIKTEPQHLKNLIWISRFGASFISLSRAAVKRRTLKQQFYILSYVYTHEHFILYEVGNNKISGFLHIIIIQHCLAHER